MAKSSLQAIEATGTIDEQHHLHLDAPLPVSGPSRVRLIILVLREEEADEPDWLRAATADPAFDFLADPSEDIYTLSDGKPFGDKG